MAVDEVFANSLRRLSNQRFGIGGIPWWSGLRGLNDSSRERFPPGAGETLGFR